MGVPASGSGAPAGGLLPVSDSRLSQRLPPKRSYRKPQKVGNRIKDKERWDALYTTLKD